MSSCYIQYSAEERRLPGSICYRLRRAEVSKPTGQWGLHLCIFHTRNLWRSFNSCKVARDAFEKGRRRGRTGSAVLGTSDSPALGGPRTGADDAGPNASFVDRTHFGFGKGPGPWWQVPVAKNVGALSYVCIMHYSSMRLPEDRLFDGKTPGRILKILFSSGSI